MSILFVAVVGGGAVVAWAMSRQPVEVAEVGRPAPGFEVELLDGGTYGLDEALASGRPLVLNLWASWCIPCRTEMPEISEFAAENPGVSVLGVAVEDRLEDAVEFAAEIDPVYPLAVGDPAFEASYPRLGLPVTYFIDTGGMVTAVRNGIVDYEDLEELTAG
jgi:cytochrome c biogenesis protein CcmG/thiol:disulfide interchange protein DsbE